MRVLIYGINYAPELTGIGKYTGEMSNWLAARGHDVSVVTGMPYYPAWKIKQQYRNVFWKTEIINRVKVYRGPLYVPKKVTASKRILHEISFVLGSIPTWIAMLFRRKFDVVICISPPFHLGLFPLLYSKIFDAQLISHIQDLQVDAAKDLGMIKNQSFLNIMLGMEQFLLRKSDFVSTISSGMEKKIAAKGVPSSKLIFFPNWVDPSVVFPVSKEDSLRRELGLGMDSEVILYSGNLGEKQGLEMIIYAAKLLEYRPKIKFVIVGTGGGKKKLVKLIEELNATNVQLLPLQPYEKLSALLASADLHLVLQKKSASDLVMPSKLTGILAVGGCAIVTAPPNTSLHDVIVEHKMGIVIDPESVDALRDAICKALDSPREEISKNALRYAQQYLDKDTILRRFESALLQATSSSSKKGKSNPSI